MSTSDSSSPKSGRAPGGGVRALDLGTGGGERFADIIAGYALDAVATEEWQPNVAVAATSLRPHHGTVVHCSSLRLPFADASFDLVLSRHESIMPSEIARTLRPGGAFLTQQTWRYMEELHYYISRTADFGDHFNGYGSGLYAAGLTILDARQHVLPHAFQSLEDLVYLLCIAAWEIPDFDPLGRDLKALLALERDLTTADGLTLTCGHYIIEAHKPA
jgi:SAM-dependent methyltransferase